jgi:predicted nucleic acid-binding protein
MRTVIADTSAIYALVDADDVHHAEAAAFIKQEGRRLTLVVTDTTLFEAITLIKSRLGQAVATRALKAIQTSRRYRVISLTEQDRAETWRIFEQYADKDWSPFDCACLAVARTRKISEAFAFDEHFDQMAGSGLIRLPF